MLTFYQSPAPLLSESKMNIPGHFESELGVPIPGRVLPREQWVHTALKSLPVEGPLHWESLFGRVAPVVLDLGCGNGRYLLGRAVNDPAINGLGIDVLPMVVRYARKRANQRGLQYLRWAVLGAQELLERYVAPHSVAEVHLYHPQPHHDPSKTHLRLVTPLLLALVRRSLAPDGLFVVQTDNAGYWNYLRGVLPEFFTVENHPKPWPDAPQGRTRREIYALQHGLKVFRVVCRPREDLDDAAALARAAALPQPEFSAGGKKRLKKRR